MRGRAAAARAMRATPAEGTPALRLSSTDEASRPDEQHRDHHEETEDVDGGASHEERTEPLDPAEEQAAEDCAGEASHPTNDDDDEGLHHGQRAHGRADREDGSQQAARAARERAADAEAEGGDRVDVDALERGGVGILSHRSHGATRPAQAQEEIEGDDQDDGGEGHHQPLDRDDQPEHPDDSGEGRGHRLVEHAEGQLRARLHDPEQPERHDERVERLAAQVVEDQPLGRHARDPDREDGQAEGGEVVQAEERIDVISDVASEHVELAVGEVDDLEDGEDEGETEGDQHVDHRQAEAVEKRLDEEVNRHGSPTTSTLAAPRPAGPQPRDALQRVPHFFSAAGSTWAISTTLPSRISLMTTG